MGDDDDRRRTAPCALCGKPLPLPPWPIVDGSLRCLEHEPLHEHNSDSPLRTAIRRLQGRWAARDFRECAQEAGESEVRVKQLDAAIANFDGSQATRALLEGKCERERERLHAAWRGEWTAFVEQLNAARPDGQLRDAEERRLVVEVGGIVWQEHARCWVKWSDDGTETIPDVVTCERCGGPCKRLSQL